MKYILALLVLLLSLHAQAIDDIKLKKMIGSMLIVGFDNQTINYNSQIVHDIQEYNLGGVILFDKFYNERYRVKNILRPYQLRQLTKQLQYFGDNKLFVGIDQEGGRVARLKPKYGFQKIPSAFKVAKLSNANATKIYSSEAKMIHDEGINLNFAPVVDLNLNPKNRVIVELQRSYSQNPSKVVHYAKILIEAQKKEHIISVLKHFPGHGSSLGDSHQGFVDITDTWSEKELEPYKELIASHDADMIMTAHVFNAKLDAIYPATLSYKTNTELLREKMHFKGVIISDDMQMKAISDNYSLKEATTLAINSGVDILLFGNQLAQNSTREIVETIFQQVKKGVIPLSRIITSNRRISFLRTKNSIIQKPIKFTKKRIDLTKLYMQKHYDINASNIEIKPKTIVLHWTAVMDLNASFHRLDPEILFNDRKDIASASSLNVSAHFLVDRDGTIYQLMPDNWMARHVIGLNYSSIGIENVGGKMNKEEDLSEAQVDANIQLVNYLKNKYPSIKNLIGHYEYREFESSPLWLEKDKGYRTNKVDPGKSFMQQVRAGVNE